MKRFYLTLCLLAIAIVQCFAGGPAADIYVDALNIADGSISAIKTDGSLMTSDGSNAADLVDLPNRVRAVFASVTTDLDVGGDVNIEGDLTGVNASFTGVVEADGVELMKKDGSNADDVVSLRKLNVDEGFLLASSADADPPMDSLMFLDLGVEPYNDEPVYKTDITEWFLWYNSDVSKWWISDMLGSGGAEWESDTLEGTYTALNATGSVDIAWEQISVSQSYGVGASAYQLASDRMMTDGSNATHLNTISGNIGAASTTIELTDGVKLNHGIMFLGGATYDLNNPNHVTLDNTGDNTIITFDAVGFDTSYVILRLR